MTSPDPDGDYDNATPLSSSSRKPSYFYFCSYDSVVAVWILTMIGLYWFSASFFLAKRSMTHLSQCDEAAHVLLRQTLGLSSSSISFLQAQGVLASTTSTSSDNNSNNTTTTTAHSHSHSRRRGCWMDRRVDSMVILVVDALRFDFALYHLPQSVGRRLAAPPQQHQQRHQRHEQKTQKTGNDEDDDVVVVSSSRLFQFVADPPTVTMQRLKGLTTGGLPTFADLSANFGGATVDEDSWVRQMTSSAHDGGAPFQSRGLQGAARLGFVGDDTWMDLFPEALQASGEAYPYPSFNTRDLHTVDDGCLEHIPHLLAKLRRKKNSISSAATATATVKEEAVAVEDPEALEVVVVHFLGVDHVGHTYGPNNQHMDTKLKQMDAALAAILDTLDDDASSSSCHVVYIFGDHGMTPDGNHGGGTAEEVNAALFVHTSKGCPAAPLHGSQAPWERQLEDHRHSEWMHEAQFSSIRQIDLVPTISILLGLPIPYANLGSVVPSLLPPSSTSTGRTALGAAQHVATALALNAAQVWRYLTVYSATASTLPHLPELEEKLQLAVTMYQQALAANEQQAPTNTNNNHADQRDQDDPDLVEKYHQAAALLKIFLHEALALGQRVWTRFDTWGMAGGIAVLAVSLVLYALPVMLPRRGALASRIPPSHYSEVVLAIGFMVFQCGVLTFGNSYILEESHSVMYSLAVLSFVVALRLRSEQSPRKYLWVAVALVPVASRTSELLVTGHGLDSSIPLHGAHNPVVFLSSLVLLGVFRWRVLYQRGITKSLPHTFVDCLTLACLAGSWWEKRRPDLDRKGFTLSRVALVLLSTGIPLILFQSVTRSTVLSKHSHNQTQDDMLTCTCKVLIAIMAVTGPSTSTSLVLYVFQTVILFQLGRQGGPVSVSPAVLAALWKLVTRHAFFVTNHGCGFNRLQYSAAFVATEEFNFVMGGISLFLNTFGWEMVGLAFAWLLSSRLWHNNGASSVWRIYGLYQLFEALSSCISVSLLRRHLMVWDIYAPHFLFTAIFTVLNGLTQLSAALLSSS